MPSVAESLAASPARPGPCLDLGQGQAVALWSNARARVRYEGTRHHTVSLYLQGGSGCRRVDGGLSGRPGALCLMPQGAPSEWQIAAPFRFVHLYLPDAALRATLAETFDRAPATLDLPELTYVDDPQLATLMTALAAIAAGCGYSSQSHLTRAFRKATGLTPGTYARLCRS